MIDAIFMMGSALLSYSLEILRLVRRWVNRLNAYADFVLHPLRLATFHAYTLLI